MSFDLPKLDYSYDALEPYFDALTMEIHHNKHHATYTNNLNNAIKENNLEDYSLKDLLQKKSDILAIRNNAGGYYNHNLFWKLLTPNSKTKPSEKLATAIDSNFGSFEDFKEEFTKASTLRFGSGWSWLVINKDKLFIGSTPNQDSPLMPDSSLVGQPILALDVWEHSYYLKYQNRRPEYISAFFHLINWDYVSELYNSYSTF